MRKKHFPLWLLLVQLARGAAITSGQSNDTFEQSQPDRAEARPSEVLLEALEPTALRELVVDVLQRNPDVARE